MTTGVVMLNFGEPADPDREAVVDYLERIFHANTVIEGDHADTDARERARQLAARRAPSLLEEYEAINGSPLAEQAHAHADALEAELTRRGYDARAYVGMQYTPPFIDETVSRALNDGVTRLIGLPMFPLCGPSTTIAALDELADAVETAAESIALAELPGWHKHPGYARLRVDNIATHAEEVGIDLDADDTVLVFSAHGTPLHYIEQGSRYVEYVEEYCQIQAALLEVKEYHLGYQNHENRGVEWTQPPVETVIRGTDAATVVVEPVSFMHEQSETLSELDIDLRATAEAARVELSRVPIPHDDPRFPTLLADLIEPLIVDTDPTFYNLYPCQCRNEPGAVCLNAGPHSHRNRLNPSIQE